MKRVTRYIRHALALLGMCVVGCASNQVSDTERVMELIEEANHYYEIGLLSTAESKYRSILRIQPSYQEAWLKLGNIYVRNDQLDAAVVAYELCLERGLEDVRCWNNLALTRLKQAVDTLQKAKRNFTAQSDEFRDLNAFQDSLIGVLSNK